MRLGGVVLAGGRSRRMGTDKARLDWHGTPLVVHVARRLAEAVDGPVVVVAAPGRPLPDLPPGIETAHDLAPDRGPLEGLAAGLRHLAGRAGAAVVCATDQPFAHGLAARLLSALDDDHDAVAFAHAGGRLEPLGALYRTDLDDIARQRLDSPDASLRGLLNAVRTHTLPADAEARAALRSLDTPEAYAEALRP